VRAPKGAHVVVRCLGESCPFDKRQRTAWFAVVRFHGFNRAVQPGTVLEISVADPDAIGKFTRFKIRDGKPPKRTDRCLDGEQPEPIRCPHL
jgi:hypothetical protein